MAGKCRNRTYQPSCPGLSGFEDRAGHQTRTFPRSRKPLFDAHFRPSSNDARDQVYAWRLISVVCRRGLHFPLGGVEAKD